MTMNFVAKPRKGEPAYTVPVRSDRLFAQYDHWYFRTRENIDIGPFDSAKEAIQGIQDFIDFIQSGGQEIIEKAV